MTKGRDPLSIDAALAKIAGQISGAWKGLAELTGYNVSTVRAWGDEDRKEQINLPTAILLDIAYQEAGGIGCPLYEAYGDLIRAAQAEKFGDKQQLQIATIEFMKENCEAETALLEASQPEAGRFEEEIAIKELIDVRNKADELLVKMGRKPP